MSEMLTEQCGPSISLPGSRLRPSGLVVRARNFQILAGQTELYVTCAIPENTIANSFKIHTISDNYTRFLDFPHPLIQ